MVPANQTNSQSLSDVPFLRNLADTFHVESIPLAIFLLIIVCLACIGLLVVIILCVKSCMRRAYLRKPKRKGLKSAYLDEIIEPTLQAGDCGLLTFSINYDITSQLFRVVVIEAKELVTNSTSKTLDAYATVRLARRSGQAWVAHGMRYKTDIQRHTAVPRWVYTANYTLTENDLKLSKLIIDVYDYDNLGQDRSVGRLELMLGDIDMDDYVGTSLEKTLPLVAGSQTYKGIGELCVGLAYLSNPGCIEAFVYEARRLDINYMISPGKDQISVLVELKNKRRTLGTFETKGKVDTVNPYFNEKGVFTIKEKHLNEAYVVCSLQKRGFAGRRSTLARAVIGPQSALNTGVKQWDEMKKNSPRTHVMWHFLVPEGAEIEP